jgi:hypothetical protein
VRSIKEKGACFVSVADGFDSRELRLQFFLKPEGVESLRLQFFLTREAVDRLRVSFF